MNLVTFDLETKELATDLEQGWKALLAGQGGISAFIGWSSQDARPYIFDDNCLAGGVSLLENADVVLSFNGVNFDVPLIEGHFDRKLTIKCHLDLHQMIREALESRQGPRRGYTLEECSLRSLGRGKTGSGKDAPTLYQRGLYAEVFGYCLDDVILTRDLFRFTQQNGGIVGVNGEILHLDIPEWFAKVQI
jgi:DEAD/DEAH box helicase domain-containing protein